MKLRALITLLLVFTVGATQAAAGARFAEREARERPALDEEREAREFAETMLARLEEEPDFAPLVAEMFVGDFAERLHASAASAGSLYFLDRAAAAEAGREEVLRHNLAFTNLLLLTSLYMTDARLGARAAKDESKADGTAGVEGSEETEDAELKPASVLPPDVAEIFKSDPLLARFVVEEPRGDASDEEEFITTVEQLRAFTAAVERVNDLLRRRLTREQKKRVFDEWRRAAEDKDSELMRPRAIVVEKEWFGYPAGTRIVCVSLLLFHVELMRVGGGYKAIALYLSDD